MAAGTRKGHCMFNCQTDRKCDEGMFGGQSRRLGVCGTPGFGLVPTRAKETKETPTKQLPKRNNSGCLWPWLWLDQVLVWSLPSCAAPVASFWCGTVLMTSKTQNPTSTKTALRSWMRLTISTDIAGQVVFPRKNGVRLCHAHRFCWKHSGARRTNKRRLQKCTSATTWRITTCRKIRMCSQTASTFWKNNCLI